MRLLHPAAHGALLGAGQPLPDAVGVEVVVALQLDDQLGGLHVLQADRAFLPVEVYPLGKDLLDLRLGKAFLDLRPALSA